MSDPASLDKVLKHLALQEARLIRAQMLLSDVSLTLAGVTGTVGALGRHLSSPNPDLGLKLPDCADREIAALAEYESVIYGQGPGKQSRKAISIAKDKFLDSWRGGNEMHPVDGPERNDGAAPSVSIQDGPVEGGSLGGIKASEGGRHEYDNQEAKNTRVDFADVKGHAANAASFGESSQDGKGAA